MAAEKLLRRVRQTIERHRLFHPGEKAVVGVSGGPDSVCLLHALRTLAPDYGLSLHVAHLNHELRGEEAEEDERFVANLAEGLALPVHLGRADVRGLARREKLSLEEAARRARYAFLQEVAKGVGASAIVVGHTADDQVETVLMHWLRGAGLAGLSGMRPESALDDFRLVRPLLEVSREEVLAYCEKQGLSYRFDRSNLDLTFFRNRLRHELLPTLETYNPRIRQAILRMAKGLDGDYEYLRGQVEKAWQELAGEVEGGISFPLDGWRGLHPSLQRYLLREAIQRLRKGLRNINWVHIESALEAGLEKPTGTQVTLPQGLTLYMGYEEFTIGEAPPRGGSPLLAEPQKPLKLQIPGITKLPGSAWQVQAEVSPRSTLPPDWERNADRWLAYLDRDSAGEELHLRGRRPGDRFQPLGMAEEKMLRDFMIDSKVPQHIRDRLPLASSPRHIVWVAGWRIDERSKVSSTTKLVIALRFVMAC